jgi:hypothetical protein
MRENSFMISFPQREARVLNPQLHQKDLRRDG